MKSSEVLYLTEEKLGNYLNLLYPNTNDWLHNKQFPGEKFRPDYRSDSLKMIVEFDGYQHYTKSLAIVKDAEKDEKCKKKGYSVVRIPYFIQLCTSTINILFGINKILKLEFPHGFIADSSTMVFPADFCELGVMKFNNDMDRFSCVKQDILKSLADKAKTIPKNAILPPSILNVYDI